MIWHDENIRQWASKSVSPYDPRNVNPASLDLRLGNKFVLLTPDHEEVIECHSIVLDVGQAILATTHEYIKMPHDAAGVLYLKSTLARMGLDHALAGYIDPGFEGELTMELHAHQRIELSAGQRIVQLVLHSLTGYPTRIYRGRYWGQRGPTPAREAHRD